MKASLVLLALGGLGTAFAQIVTPENEIPSWASESSMQLSMSDDRGELLPFDYTIIPSTPNAGANESSVVHRAIKIEGIMTAATQSTYSKIVGDQLIAYMSCDESSDSDAITPNTMLAALMESAPKAIVLYSTVGNWCYLSGITEDDYPTIFSMADAGDSAAALEVLTSANDLGVIQVTITGNTTDGSRGSDGGDSHSAVAMKILYAITALITFLFLAIICTGAVRAHRHPERYGPRASYGGRPRQSRARGLARAVLETLPVVKFGDPDPPKPDPNYELEGGQVERSDRPVESLGVEQPQRPSQDSVRNGQAAAAAATAAPGGGGVPHAEENPGCTICTEDFKVGEHVRVLPCDHKFHPSCIDPWLVNVSGTCPLCRLDLRPRREDGSLDVDGEDALPPPLEPDEVEGGPQQRGASRTLDLHRLRHASIEERILALRQYRTERDEAPSDTASEGDSERRQGKRLADRLRDRFRIRTNRQADRREE